LLLQFHPELMDNSLGYLILSKAVTAKNAIVARSCSRIFAH